VCKKQDETRIGEMQVVTRIQAIQDQIKMLKRPVLFSPKGEPRGPSVSQVNLGASSYPPLFRAGSKITTSNQNKEKGHLLGHTTHEDSTRARSNSKSPKVASTKSPTHACGNDNG